MAFNREKALAAAAKFAAKGQHDRSAAEYAKIVEHDPSDVRSWLMWADCLVRSDDKPGAIDKYQQVARFYTDKTELSKAVAVYRQILNLDPGRLDVHQKIAEHYRDLGHVADAVATYEFVAQAYFQAGEIPRGLEAFRIVADLEPGAVGKRLRLAELYSREGMIDEAVEHFGIAASRLLADRRFDDYIRVAERLIYHREDDLTVLRTLARIYLDKSEARRALVKLNALLRNSPSDTAGLELLGETFIALGKLDKAVHVVVELAREQRKRDRNGKEIAARVLRRALEWSPENTEEVEALLVEIEAEIEELKQSQPEEPEDDALLIDMNEEEVDIDIDIVEEEEEEVEEERPPEPESRFQAVEHVVEGTVDELVAEVDEEVGTDLDKVLVEARVYVKYKMYEHALRHLEGVFVTRPDHPEGRELRAEILAHLKREREAAEEYIELAEKLAASEPTRAQDLVARALKLAPTSTRGRELLAALERGAPPPSTPRPSEPKAVRVESLREGQAQRRPKVNTGTFAKPPSLGDGKPRSQRPPERDSGGARKPSTATTTDDSGMIRFNAPRRGKGKPGGRKRTKGPSDDSDSGQGSPGSGSESDGGQGGPDGRGAAPDDGEPLDSDLIEVVDEVDVEAEVAAAAAGLDAAGDVEHATFEPDDAAASEGEAASESPSQEPEPAAEADEAVVAAAPSQEPEPAAEAPA
ncbi:MAG: tetratricopeptide repeat protein, partial [Myxococcales bacterium]|nr:tetratricopeptide repeat protein [Myxococcales bacterium]